MNLCHISQDSRIEKTFALDFQKNMGTYFAGSSIKYMPCESYTDSSMADVINTRMWRIVVIVKITNEKTLWHFVLYTRHNNINEKHTTIVTSIKLTHTQ